MKQPSMNTKDVRSSKFLTAFLAGMAAPVALFSASSLPAYHAGHYSVSSVFAQVGLRMGAAYQQVCRTENKNA